MPITLHIPGLTESDFPRLRGVETWDQETVRVTTRTGAGNVRSSARAHARLMEHEAFLRVEADPHDSTYLYWFFRVPARP
jgi:hypothetical protein